ncbi:flavodoxin domain-containing protein [Marinobacterium weihaiense]|uniref:Flavodoxin-like domain-containing protein n=1 Tax=Marinobacterium weihaiense TaxID=2851016 RepID=A0ABS6MA03_9GAMM|nr:flavodoxin family protein [Marinobacterium weihaiense]MBV0933113.1 flavodoxin-like domain-containing protein [Marinobacterium weihaiense]
MKTLAAAVALALLLVWQLDDVSGARRWIASLALLAYAAVLAAALRRSGDRAGLQGGAQDYCIAYATETGTARQLAQATRKRLRQTGFQAEVVALNRLADTEVPEQALLLVASTTGQGDAPKTAQGWDDAAVLARFDQKPYAVLALGDRSYPRFCAFGLEVHRRLQAAGAQPLFDPVQVSQADPRMVDVWFRQLLPASD